MKPIEGDLVLGREAPVGDVIRVPNTPRVCLGQRTVLIRPDPNRVDPRFLQYWLIGPDAQSDMRGRAAGATVAHLNVEDIRELDVVGMLNDRRQQRTIGSVLGAIDDLIENNRRRIALLEQMAQAIYREWFVHLRYPGHEGDELVDSPLGPIPKGWEVVPLSDSASISRQNVQPSRSADLDFEHFSIPNFDEGGLPRWENGVSIRSGKYLVSAGSVLVSKLNPRIRRVWLVEPSTNDRSVASTEFLVLRPKGGWSLELLYLMLQGTLFQEQLIGLSGGTSTSHQRAKPTDFMALNVVKPPDGLLSEASKTVKPVIRSAGALRVQAALATEVRDLLLPKLVTGAIDVSHVHLEAFLEDTAA
ncbi:MAG: restriction endonuclease subunit S [Gaiellaceae bacterium]